MKRALLAAVLLAGCSSMGEVDRARLLHRIELLGDGFALGKTPARAAAIRSETAELVSDVNAAIR